MYPYIQQHGENGYDELKRQIVWFFISIPIMVVVIFIDYNYIAKISPIFYGIFILLLIAVLFTPVVNGATSWFTITDGIKFQPSEFAKIFVIIFLVISSEESKNKRTTFKGRY